MSKPHIVILGAGFGGTYVAQKLVPYAKKGMIELTIVNRTNYFLFTPLLHEVATGALSPTSVAEPLREIFAGTGVHIVQGTVESIDRTARVVEIGGHLSMRPISYDYLVIATGSQTNYFGVPGADRYSYPLKDLSDAARIRSQVIDSFEQAILVDDPSERARLLSFAVVGGGATGVETAAELAELVHSMVHRYYGATAGCHPGDPRTCRPEEPFVTLIHMGSHVLEMFSPPLRSAAERRLRQAGVDLQLESIVSEVSPAGLLLKSGSRIPAATVIWTAGVKPVIPRFRNETPTLVAGRLVVDGQFRVAGDACVFALGDVAGYIDPDRLQADPAARPVPMLAQVASAQSAIVARNLIASIRGIELTTFHYHSKGSMVSVGQWFALGEIFSLNIAGRLTWWLWRTLYLFKFASWKKRFRIAFEWALELVSPRDITKLT